MSRVNTGLAKRDLTAQANEIAELKRDLGVGDQPSTMLLGASDDPLIGDDEKGTEGTPAMRYGQIMVAVRKRPKIPSREDEQNDVLRCGESGNDLTVYAPKVKVDLTPVIEPTHFVFDAVFSERQGNSEVYQKTTRPLLQTVKEGGSAVVFAFGQTGSGKTYTMMGYEGKDPGLYSLAVHDVFELMGAKVRLSANFYEIYGAKCFDLLNGRNEVRVMQDEYKNVHVVGIVERKVENHDDILELMKAGSELRSSGQTHANDRSSRSHAVLVINLKTKLHGALYSRMTFVDLAGSERASDTTNTDKKTQREGAEINKSLLALKECIRAMGMRKRHIPFRGSKLTQILRESFIGNCSTCVIANVSPCQSHCEDTLNTLRYADRIKELKADGGGDALTEAPVPCHNCGDPIFVGDRHVCRRVTVQCSFCRETMEKDRLEDHLTVCKEAPAPCPHCFTRILQGEVAKHQKKCLKIPVKCPMCEQPVPREGLPKHQKETCAFARVPCRHCRGLFPRGELDTHEEACQYQQVVCPHCLMPMKKMRIEAHMSSECTSSKGREARTAAIPQTARGPEHSETTNNANNNKQRSPSVGGAPLKRQSSMSRNTSSSPNRTPAQPTPVFQGAQGIAQLAKQRHASPQSSATPPSLNSDQLSSGARRPYTMHGGAAGTDARLPRLSALERGSTGLGIRNTVPPPVTSPSAANSLANTPRGGPSERRAISAAGAGINAGRVGGLSPPPVRAFAPAPPQGTAPLPPPSFGQGQGVVASDCPYCNARVASSLIEAHVSTDCQFAPVNCPYYKYGCTKPLHRIHITKHMTEQMSHHLELVVEYAEAMERDNDELRYLLATQTPGARSGAGTPRGVLAGGDEHSNTNADDVADIIARSYQNNNNLSNIPTFTDHTLVGHETSLNMAANTMVAR